MNSILVTDSIENPVIYKKSKIDQIVNIYRPGYKEFMDIAGKDIDDIYNVDSRDCISIIDSNNNEISLGEYKSEIDIKFFKISDDLLKEHNAEFYVSTDFLYERKNLDSYTWSDGILYTPKDKLPDYVQCISLHQNLQKLVINQFNGYDICQLILSCKHEKSIATLWCDVIDIDNGGVKYHGFLPSVYQLKLLSSYLYIIKDFNKHNGIDKVFNIYLDSGLWTCNEVSPFEAWYINILFNENHLITDNKKFYIGNKQFSRRIFPVFKKIN